MAYFAEREDVRLVLQKTNSKFGSNQLSNDIVDAAIGGVSNWFLNQTDGYWYDSNKTGSDLIDSSGLSVTGVIQSVPSSPHRQGKQLFRHQRGSTRYLDTHDGIHVRVRLPALYVESIDKLEVKDRDGGVTDWVADSDITEGRGEDYYLQVDGSTGFGVSYLYLRAGSIGSRVSYSDLLTIDFTVGRDEQNSSWADVRRGIAALAGAQLITDDNVLAGLPDQGSAIGVATQVQNVTSQALGIDAASNISALEPYMGAAVA